MVDNDWIRPLSRWLYGRKCLEIMSGSGALSRALQDHGINIRATDNYTWKTQNWVNDLWTEVENIDCIEAIEKYGRNIEILLCCWPTLGSNAVYEALLSMRKVNPEMRMIYIGEGQGGATANDDFFEEAHSINDMSFDNICAKFKRFYGLHDWPMLIK